MDGTVEGSNITREDVLSLKFPIKLWLLVNTPNKIVQWTGEGESFTIDFVTLDDYLCSPPSIFRVKSKSGFINNLDAYGFQSVATEEQGRTENGFICEFKHEHFLKGRSDLVAKIVKRSGALASQGYGFGRGGIKQRTFKPPNKQYDPCHGLIRTLSEVEKARLNLRVILQVQSESYILYKKMSESDENSPSSLVSVIELPAEAFENPLDSISRFKENPEIAGFYGHASTDLVKRFFDAYLPLYAQSNGEANARSAGDSASQTEETAEYANLTPSMAVMETDSNKYISEDPSHHSNFQINYSVSLDSNESKEYTVNLLDETTGQITSGTVQYGARMPADGESYYTQPTASALEPIYRNCDDDTEANNKEEDISMDHYLKFKTSPQKNSGILENLSEDIKMEEFKTEPETSNNDELNDDTENFRNFFNQYRESINLLYE